MNRRLDGMKRMRPKTCQLWVNLSGYPMDMFDGNKNKTRDWLRIGGRVITYAPVAGTTIPQAKKSA